MDSDKLPIKKIIYALFNRIITISLFHPLGVNLSQLEWKDQDQNMKLSWFLL